MNLTCVISDGDGTQWEYEWKTTSLEKPVKSTEDWVFYTSVSSDGDYWCRGRQKMDLRPTTWSYPIRWTVLCKAIFFSIYFELLFIHLNNKSKTPAHSP